jgi:type I restriction enzyme M protein
MSSQGDAGQFRTPRHIIDFIVSVVDPQKTDSILDPACGTAGFLISAIKHIEKANMKDYPGDLLEIDEKKKLAENVVGYDISPDMRRISLVNMFLHNINEPHIYEYDTLSSTDRWEDDFSCILANPPFMSPKGGIKPHSRFGIPSTRSEVLFVDYIMEHLNIDGKADVIVPEGIIFQGQKAFKNLRKKMVDDCFLWAVVSLPSGVFNPYSGVKTSILFFDREIAKKTDDILFVKIEADGYNLGAQRKPIEQNDLPEAYEALTFYKTNLKLPSEDHLVKSNGTREIAHTAKKKDISSLDYNLSANRYVITEIRTGKWPRVRLGKVCEIISGQSPEGIYYNSNGEGTPFYQGKTEFTDIYLGKPVKWTTQITKRSIPDDIVMSVRAPVGPVNIVTQDICIGRGLAAIRCSDIINYMYCFYCLRHLEDKIQGNSGAVFPSISRKEIENIEIPLPPLEVQKEIVAEIEGYQKIIDGAKQIIDNWKPKIDIDPNWPMIALKQVAKIESGYGFPLLYQGTKDKEIPFIKVSDMNIRGNDLYIRYWNNTVTFSDLNKMKAKTCPEGTVIFPKIGAAINTNKKRILTCDTVYDNNVMGLVPDTNYIIPRYLHTLLLSFDISKWGSYSQPPSIRKTTVEEHPIPLPPLSVQEKIVSQIEKEQTYIDKCKKLLEIYQTKIKDRINKLWKE